MLFVKTWVELEGIMLGEMSQRKTNSVWFHLFVESKKQNKWTNRTEKKQSYRYREQTGVARGEGGGRRKEIGKED